MRDTAAWIRQREFEHAQAAIDRMQKFPKQILTLSHPRGEAYAAQVGVVNGTVSVNEGEDVMVLARLQALNVGRMDLDEMVDLLHVSEGLKSTYEKKELPVPEPLSTGIETLNASITSHRRDAIAKRLKEIRAQKTTLLSVQEKRDALDKEEASLQAQFSGSKEPVPAT